VLWRAEPRDGDKPAKVPYRAAEPSMRASSTDPATWATFEDAAEAYAALVDLDPDPRRGRSLHRRGADVGGWHHVHRPRPRDRRGGPARPSRRDDRGALRLLDRDQPERDGATRLRPGGIERALKGPQIEVYASERYICVTAINGRARPTRSGGSSRTSLTWFDSKPRATPPVARTQGHDSAPDDLAGALLAKLQTWGIPAARVKRWSSGYLVELRECPWADEHSTSRGGAAVMIHASGAFDFTCLHAHCAGRTWRDFRAAMEQPS